jgi:hypothetical protein
MLQALTSCSLLLLLMMMIVFFLSGRYFEAMQSSSKVCPYITAEVSGWHPSPPENPNPLPPTLALGGAEDKVIRPFQVAAAADRWGAKVVVLEGVTHDVMLGPQGELVASKLLSWLTSVPVAALDNPNVKAAADGPILTTVTASAAMGPAASAAAVAGSQQQQQLAARQDPGSITYMSSGSSSRGDKWAGTTGSSGSASRSRADVGVFSRNGPDPPAAFS